LLSQLYVCQLLNSNAKENHWAFMYQQTLLEHCVIVCP
jgi:hypothetical protein